jgi:hypothetical protein
MIYGIIVWLQVIILNDNRKCTNANITLSPKCEKYVSEIQLSELKM